jgi:hypothetical protein
MPGIFQKAATAWRDYKTIGLPASGYNEPAKNEIRDVFATIQEDVAAAALGGIDPAGAAALVAPIASDAQAARAAAEGARDDANSTIATARQAVTDAQAVLTSSQAIIDAADAFGDVATQIGTGSGVVVYEGGDFAVADRSEFRGPTGTVTNASGFLGAIATATGAGRKPLVVRSFDAVSVATVDTNPAYTGVGTATQGAGRFFFGTLTPSGDDSAICVGRDVRGSGLFSHAFRDESRVLLNVSGAYTAFDARHTYVNNSDGTKLNHGYSFQASPEYANAGGTSLGAGLYSNARFTAGRVDDFHHVHISNITVSGGASVGTQRGVFVDTLTGGDGTNWGLWVSTNKCFLGGDVQMNNGVLSGMSRVTANEQITGASGNFIGSPGFYSAAGGVQVIGSSGAAAYAEIRAYVNGSAAAKGLTLQGSGGQVLVRTGGVPVTGERFECEGFVGSDEGYRVDGVKVVGNRGAAVADATDAASAITQLNALLARMRAHGLIA